VCADWRGPSDDDYADAVERPVGMRPVGMRPVGMRPVGMRPVGMRPVGMRPVGMRPVGMRPVGMRPVGMRPVGMRPVGMRPVGMRPVGMRDDGTEEDAVGGGYLDPAEWAADIAMLFCDASAVLRLGARLVVGSSDLPVPARSVFDIARYLPEPVLADDAAAQPDAASMREAADEVAAQLTQSETRMFFRRLRPRTHELSVQVVMRNRLVTSMVERPDVAWAVKQDLAGALALRADQGFLHGDAADRGPLGITRRGGESCPVAADDDLLATARKMLRQVRLGRRRFANPGWILHPATLDQVSQDLAAKPPNDAGHLLTYDGADGGTLLGYPYVVSAAAEDTSADDHQIRIYFSSDWSEAWIGCEDPLATVDVTPNVRMATDETVVRAVARHDFTLRIPPCFVYSDSQPGRQRRRR
jgi:HK97 family phage major capsid protein